MMLLMYLLLFAVFFTSESCVASYAQQETTQAIQERPAVVPNPPREANPVRRTGPVSNRPRVMKATSVKRIETTPEGEELLRDYESARAAKDERSMEEIRERLTKMGIPIPE